ncbi:putative tetrapyrrole methylase family protein [Prochlorococcus marinus str. MIT 9515]|uniref:Ribosomal RNA small subunit methyltransferase I n=1 Tax=Prochlorococcus marinus (strain MIT 9515) TaxID=167542 RepID=A2BXR1_PROM5|nr:16S rRNA (cytidine(1402)-2'-O)-methyltransferase [Prochlorococcus marinus]ABM72572.1 putative tetrapyrrole methylase family protein [Prochlorococcus marinus str. MIT 9515]
MNNKFSLSHRNQEPENGVLYLVGTPIGNLNDLSLRAIDILKNVCLIACEDTRQTKKIMSKFGIKNHLISFNKDNSFKKIPSLISDLIAGKSIAVVSDAGMPSICDPGEDLVSKAKSLGIDVVCVPGPCAAIAALVSSGLPSSKFIFEGFLPKKQSDRKKILLEISNNEKTTILFESPKRLNKLLRELKEFCGGEREIQVSRELTKKFEEHIGKNINMVLEFFEGKTIVGEITIVIKGINKTKKLNFDESLIKKELYALIDAGLSLPAASKYLAKKENLTRKIIYNLY